MSGGRYPDLKADSGNGRYCLTAHSNDKGPRRSLFPSGFTYRMSGAARWERQSKTTEPYPLELHVSDEGYSVVQLHSPLWPPRLLAISPRGRDLIDLAIGPSTDLERWKGPVWVTADLAHTTAGTYWTFGSWQYFLAYNGQTCFVSRTKSGQRLVLGLSAQRAEILELSPELVKACEVEEVATVMQFLARPGKRNEQKLTRALVVLWRYLPPDCIPFLRRLAARRPTGSTTSWALARPFGLKFGLRPQIHWLLRRLGESPGRTPAYEFVIEGRSGIFPRPPERDRLLQSLTVLLSALDVLELAGSPDAILTGAGRSEVWEYDLSSSNCVRLSWNLEKEPATVESIDSTAIDWPEREAQLHRYAH